MSPSSSNNSASEYPASDASSESGSSTSSEIMGEYSFIPLDATHSLMLISELLRLFEKHLQLSESKGKSKEAKQVATDILGRTEALINPLLATEDQRKNAINAFRRFLGHKNKNMVSKAIEYINQGEFDALVSGSTDVNINIFLIANFVFFCQKSAYDKNEGGNKGA